MDLTGPKFRALPNKGTCLMPTKEKTVQVAVCVTPSGGVHFILPDQTSVNTVNKSWENSLTPERLEEHKSSGTCGGAMKIVMLADDYAMLPKSSR